MNDLHSLHDKINEAFVGRLHDALSQLRSGADCVSQAIESPTGDDALRAHAAQGRSDAFGHTGGGEVALSGPNCYGVMCPQHGHCARYYAVDGAIGNPPTIGTCYDAETRERPLFVAVVMS